VLYEAATGQVPFPGDDAVSVAVKQVSEMPKPPSQINPDIDPELESIILRAMSKNPADRYATADAMRIALNNYLAGRPIDTGVADPATATRVMGAGTAVAVGAAVAGLKSANSAAADELDNNIFSDKTSVLPPTKTSPINYSDYSPTYNNKNAKKSNKKVPIIIAIIAAVLVVGFGVFLFFTLSKPAAASVTVPDVTSMEQSAAEAKITEAKLVVGTVTQQASDSVGKGQVISTDPKPGAGVKEGTKVNLVVSSGPVPVDMVNVPNLQNKTADAALQELIGLGLKGARGTDRASDSIEAGKVCGQDPAAGSQLEKGSTVTYYVSTGKSNVDIPNVVGKTESDAKSSLENAGFKVDSKSDSSETVTKGQVISQSPTADTSAAKGSTVTITVSSGKAPVQQVAVPNVKNMTLAQASAKIASAGLVYDYDDVDPVTDASLDGVVTKTNPAIGTKVDPGTKVVIYVGKLATDTNSGTDSGNTKTGSN
jgi:serine/threonine-protein kinase